MVHFLFIVFCLSLPYLSFASPLRTVCPYLNVRLVWSTLWSPIGLYHAFINHRGANYTQSKQYSRQKLTVCAKKTMNFLDIAFINHRGAKYLKVNNHIRYSKVLLELIIFFTKTMIFPYCTFINHRGANYTQSKHYSRQKILLFTIKYELCTYYTFTNHRSAE